MRLYLLIGCLLLSGACSKPVTVFDRDHLPAKLSDWGVVYRSDSELVVNNQTLAYDLNTPLFTDYAHKLRTAYIPDGAAAQIDGERINLPVGSIISKTFYYPLDQKAHLVKTAMQDPVSESGLDLTHVKLMETRLLVHMADGWMGLPYVWDTDQQDATLQLGGDLFDLTLEGETFPYAVPDFNQCQGCHIEDLQANQMSAIGLKTRHVKPGDMRAMQARNWLPADLDIPSLEQNADWLDESVSLDDRARSYLDINCGHCHNPVGAADTSGLFLHRGETDALKLGLCKPPIAAGQGTGGHRVNIDPGHPERSIMTYRMQSTDLGAMMPELGRSLAHEEGVALIEEWISQLPGEC